MREPLLLVGGAIVLAVTVAAVFAPVFAAYDPIKLNLAEALRPPSWAHWLGTDDLGRDVLARTLYGGRISLAVGFFAMVLATSLGTVVGLAAGYWGGGIDSVLMRMMDGVLAIPALLLAIGITAALGPGLNNATVAIGIVYVPAFARLARGQALALREEEYALAARAMGADSFRILFRHLLPNMLTTILVMVSLRVSSAILAEAGLSFLGLGAQPPTPSWGAMVSQSRRYLEVAPWTVFAPGAAIFLTIIGLSLLSDGVQSALDPRSWIRHRANRDIA